MAVSLSGPKTARLWFGGQELELDRSTSNAEDGETRWGEGDVLSPSWFFQWGVAGRDLYVANFNEKKVETDLAKLPEAAASGAVDFARHLDQKRAEVLHQQMLDEKRKGHYWRDPLRMYKQWGHYPDPYR